MSKNAVITALILLVSAMTAFAQSSAFNYQGCLNDTGAAANGSFQFQFKLFDAASGGTQIGATINDVTATVSNGIFSVSGQSGQQTSLTFTDPATNQNTFTFIDGEPAAITNVGQFGVF
jgi:hypothetical protein